MRSALKLDAETLQALEKVARRAGKSPESLARQANSLVRGQEAAWPGPLSFILRRGTSSPRLIGLSRSAFNGSSTRGL